MGKICSKCGEANIESASYCASCGYNLEIVTAPPFVKLIALLFLSLAFRNIFSLIFYTGITARIAELIFPLWFVFACKLVTACAEIYISYFLWNLYKTALYLFYVVSIAGLIGDGYFLFYVNPHIRGIYKAIPTIPLFIPNNILFVIISMAILAAIAVRIVLLGYIFKKRLLFTK